jgi:hypothetical protein
MRIADRVLDAILAAFSLTAAPFLYLLARKRWALRWTRGIHDGIGVTVVRNHYYEPVVTKVDLPMSPERVRELPGVDFNLSGQAATLARFRFADELEALDGARVDDRIYRYNNQNNMFGEGDADALYCFIRAFKPRTFIEIGGGQSSLVAQIALRKNLAEDPARAARHICFEPFHNGWLKDIGAEYRRQKAQCIDPAVFTALEPNDIVFIDSTHVVRAQGDVEHDLLRILPILPAGVLVQIHDIFSPRDYIHRFLLNDRRFWTEQYMLEAFLTLNTDYEVILALNALHKDRNPALYEAMPGLAGKPQLEPGSFWIRRLAHP